MRTKMLILGVCFSAAACSTSYQVDGITGGQAPKWRAADVLEVEGSGNGYTSSSKLEKMTLLRAAESAIEAEYRYFIEIDSEDTSRSETTYMPTTTTTSYNAYATGSSVSGYGTSFTYGGPTTSYKPGVNALYKMFVALPPDARPGQFHDAYETYNRLGPKYIRKFEPKYPR